MLSPGRPILAAFLCLAALPAAAQQPRPVPVDLELILAADISGSMGRDGRKAQRDAMVAALRDPSVVEAVSSGAAGRIAVLYVEWSDAESQTVALPWTVLSDAASLEAYAINLAAAPEGRVGGHTSISAAMAFAHDQFELNAWDAPRRVIDLSGNGVNDQGRPAAEARDRLIAAGITINGLVLPDRDTGNPYPGPWDVDLETYFEDEVIGGPGAFVISAATSGDVAVALRRKLVLEIASLEP